jgi:hypothetical protein
MDPCTVGNLAFVRYVGNELKGQELDAFCRHLSVCGNCRARVLEERTLTMILRRARPLYPVPSTLRASVSRIVADCMERARNLERPPRAIIKITDRPAETRGAIGAWRDPTPEKSEVERKRGFCACFQRWRVHWWR